MPTHQTATQHTQQFQQLQSSTRERRDDRSLNPFQYIEEPSNIEEPSRIEETSNITATDINNAINHTRTYWSTLTASDLTSTSCVPYHGCGSTNDYGSTTEKKYKTNNHIHPYNYKPKQFHFYSTLEDTEDKPLYMGVELEIDSTKCSTVEVDEKNSIAKEVIKQLDGENEIYCVHDGSLTNGFEIVTHPCTLSYHKNKIEKYKKVFNYLIDNNYRSHDTNTCGLHIHINKKFFGNNKLHQDLNALKLLFLFEQFWSKVTTIARRNSNRFCRKKDTSVVASPLDYYVYSKNEGKYYYINLENKDTIEFRIFKGTLNYNTFIATLEFVDALCHFVKELDINEIQSVTWGDIEKTFPETLIQYIQDRENRVINNTEHSATNLNSEIM